MLGYPALVAHILVPLLLLPNQAPARTRDPIIQLTIFSTSLRLRETRIVADLLLQGLDEAAWKDAIVFSGGNVKRPGLQQLLTDIAAGLGRHHRCLQFNTTTSTGRLTLNMLLSFAQFAREVTGERIRNKIAASKKKGALDGRAAATMRTIFALYRDLRSSWKVKQEADRLGLRTKLRTSKDGRTRGGMPFRYGHIHRIVHNPLYIGQIQHGGVVHEGQHEKLMDTEFWEATLVAAGNQDLNFLLNGQRYFFHRRTNVPKKLTKEVLVVELLTNMKKLAEDPNDLLDSLSSQLPSFDHANLMRSAEKYGTYSTQKKLREFSSATSA